MLLTPSVLLLAALATGPVDDAQPLPATCIGIAGQTKVGTPQRRQHLLPSVVVQLNVAPERRGRSRFDDDTPPLSAPERAFGDSDQRLRDRTRYHWTISLRWRSSPRQAPRIEGHSSTDHLRRCDELLSMNQRRPATLAEAIDHWAETARLNALVRSAQEVLRD